MQSPSKTSRNLTCKQLLYFVVPEVCVFRGGVVQVQRVLLQPLPPPPAVKQSHAEHGSPRLLAHRSPPFHLDGEHVLQQHHAGLRRASLTYTERRGYRSVAVMLNVLKLYDCVMRRDKAVVPSDRMLYKQRKLT